MFTFLSNAQRIGATVFSGVALGLLLPCNASAQSFALISAHSDASAVANPPAPPPNMPGYIYGLVADVQGALVVGAEVSLTYAGGAASLHATSANDGSFAFPNVTPGEFTVSVADPGFDAASTAGDLQPGQTYKVTPFALKIATASVVEVVTPQDNSAAEQLHAQEQQRLLGALPNFYVSYDWNAAPLTSKQKFSLAWKNVSDPGNLFLSGTVAGVQQATNGFSGYGQGAAGYGKRFGADYGNLVVGTMMGGAVLPSVFHQDPRYFYKGTGSIRSRTLYALSNAIITRGDNGRRQPNYSGILGNFSAAGISNLYYPAENRQGATLTLENGLLGVAGDALNGLMQEFVLRHFTPSARQKVQ